MNRIYELAKEAGMIEFDSIPGSNAVTPDHTSVAKAQKFAELIVKECCALIAPSQELKKDPSFPYMGGAEGVELLDGSVRLIKEHFGVK